MNFLEPAQQVGAAFIVPYRDTLSVGGIEMRAENLAIIIVSGLTLAACNMRQDQAGPNGSEEKVGNAAMVEPIEKTPLSSTRGAAPDNSQIETRDPVVR